MEVEIGDHEIGKMVSQDPVERVKIAIKLALSPICRFSAGEIQSIHRYIGMILDMV